MAISNLIARPAGAAARRRVAVSLAAASPLLALLAMTGPASAQAPPAPPAAAAAAAAGDPVIARVEGMEIRQSDLALAEEDIGREIPATDDAGRRDYLVNYLSDLMLVAKAAEARKIPDGAAFRQRLAFLRNKALMDQVLTDETKAAVSEPALRKIYQDATQSMTGQEEIRARHILFRVANPTDQAASRAAEEKVKNTIERINKGEDFATLAGALTEDPSGKQDGGDLGYFSRDQMVPEFSEVAFSLQKGQVSGPVKTQFGWHVLKVEDRRMREPPPFDKVRGEIEEFATRKAQADFVAKLRADAMIERLDKPAEPKK